MPAPAPQPFYSTAECLAAMHRGERFSIVCVKFDRNRRTGGDLIDIEEAEMLTTGGPTDGKHKKTEQHPAERPPTELEAARIARKIKADEKGISPKGLYVRNIRIFIGGEPTDTIVKVHPRLIIQFNGKPVTP